MTDINVIEKPRVVFWFQIFCVFMTLACTVFFVGGMWAVSDAGGLGKLGAQAGTASFMLTAMALTGIAYLTALFLKPRPWVWVYGLVLIGVGFFGLLTALICIPLLVFWFKAETREYYT
jgi:hypothetical protein